MSKTLEELMQDQFYLGQEIQRVVSNYKKDPADRKNRDYYLERIRRLEDNWLSFEKNDINLKELPNHETHEYTTKNYYTAIAKIFQEYRELFEEKLKEFPRPSATPTPRQSATPTPRQSKVQINVTSPTEAETANTEEVKRMKRRQQSVLQSLNRLMQSIDRNQMHDTVYCKVKLEAVKHYWSQIEELNSRLWELVDDPAKIHDDTDSYIQAEENVQHLLVALTTRLQEQRQISSNGQQSSQASSFMKLPKIELPKFDGDYLKWKQFHDLYTEMVHKQALADCQKMWYLKANLVGEAERLIRHYSLSEENYTAAWRTLQDRYNNPRILVAALVNKLLSQPSHANECGTATSVKNLHDITQECLLGLENLGVSTENWDPLLLHILQRKLDKNTHAMYEQSLANPKELASLKDFLAFLEKRFQALEALGGKGNVKPEQHKKPSKTFSSLASTITRCILCKQNHPLYQCKQFLQKTPSERLRLVQKNKLCVNCLRNGHHWTDCKLRACTRCTKKHNTLLHLDIPEAKANAKPTDHKDIMKTESLPGSSSSTLSLTTKNMGFPTGYVILSTARVKLISNDGRTIECRAILDPGSQINVITKRLIKKMRLEPEEVTLSVEGIQRAPQKARGRINIILESNTSAFSTRIEAFVMQEITSLQPTQQLNSTEWKIPNNVRLADPRFDKPAKVDLLLGAEHFFQLLSVGQIDLGPNLPTLQNTLLGWIVSGKVTQPNQINSARAICNILTEEGRLTDVIEKFWKLEEAEESTTEMSVAEKRCEKFFNQTTSRLSNGRFVVALPFSQDPKSLGESRTVALRRFYALEGKLMKNSQLRKEYVAFMEEYIQLGHMQLATSDSLLQPNYYLPHHSVLKPDSTTTKLRVVFDASAKTTSNKSLNDILYAGPTVQDELFSILLRFRLPRFVFTADIQKMYRQIEVRKEDQQFQLIFWRKDPNEQVKCYQLRTITYGTTSAPYLATRCLQKLAEDRKEAYPYGAQILKHDFYVDDVMTGSNSVAELLQSQKELNQLLTEGGFTLRKWCSNHAKLLEHIMPKDQEIQLDFTSNQEDHVKTLGLIWFPKNDEFSISVSKNDANRVTKRTVASDLAKIFDPLGMIAPVVVRAKLFLQELWELKMDWDAAIPQELYTRWIEFRQQLHALNEIKIPRHIYGHRLVKDMQLHTFADASEKAYGAAVYIRATTQDETVLCRLLCAKSRVAPIKKITIPRLELCAAKLAAELTHRVKKDLHLRNKPSYLWTDSEIVLSWLNSSTAALPTFVANRIASIKGYSIPEQWRHVSSRDNPADIVSRGLSPERMQNCTLWFYGPLFLHGKTEVWPPAFKLQEPMTEVSVPTVSLTTTTHNDAYFDVSCIKHNNSFRKLQRITAYTLRFINRCQGNPRDTGEGNALTPKELDEALYLIIKSMQKEEFMLDINHLKRHQEVNKNSPLCSLTPFLDAKGVIRVGGRLEASGLSYDAKHPMLLPYGHPLTRLLLTDLHKENSHIGPQGLLATVRQHFWPIKGKALARVIVQHCITCTRAKPKLFHQLMGNIPVDRVQPTRPFINAGVDFCGPISIHYKLRGKRPTKAYIAVFCCFSTKAVHFEIVSDLTTDAFIAALKRFIGRRGHVQNLYCDNATNFVGASNQLSELKDVIYSAKGREAITSTCSSKSINFRFIPPRAPHFGGLWEAAVKSAKHLLVRSMANVSMTYEELETAMIDIEAVLNSRPITPLSNDPNDLSALTPGHFLIGEPLTATVDQTGKELQGSLQNRWKMLTHLKQNFWNRWSQEYLSELQHRYKWNTRLNNVKTGTLVILKEDNMPIMKWPLGRIVKIYKGEDDCVRVVDVKTASGIFKRAIHRLAPLLMTEDDEKRDDEDPFGSSQQNEENEPEETPSKRVRRTTSPSILTLLAICLILPIIMASNIEVKRFKEHHGLKFENVGKVGLTSRQWDIIVYFDLQPLQSQYEIFLKGLTTFHQLCKEINQKPTCEQIIGEFQHIQEEFEASDELLSLQRKPSRMKRGAVNFVGNMANALFGVLDNDYAVKMSETIDNIRTNEEHLLALVKNQTSIIDSTINVIRKDQSTTEARFKNLENRYQQLLNTVHPDTGETYALKMQNLVTSLAIQMTLLTTNLRHVHSLILDILADTHHGRLSPQIISPRQLKEELMTIRSHLPPSYSLPTDGHSISSLYHLITVAGCKTDKYVIFHLKIPLLNADDFDLFKITPIPTVVNNTFVAIRTTSRYLAINTLRDMYCPMSEVELNLCLAMSDRRICRLQQPLYHRGAEIGMCEVYLLNEMPTFSQCPVEILHQQPIWIQLDHPNEWIFAMKEPTVTNIVCNGEPSTITLEGIGQLKLEPECILKQKLATVRGHHNNFNSTATGHIRYSSTKPKVPHEGNSDAIFKIQQETLDEIQQQLAQQNLELPKKIEAHNNHHSITGYLSITLVAVLIIGMLVRYGYIRCRRPKRPQPKPRTHVGVSEGLDFTVVV